MKRKANELLEARESCQAIRGPNSDFKFCGRRIIELDVLGNELDSGCKTCGNPLQLSNCYQETISGLGSFLYISCGNAECGEMNVCHTNKIHRASGARRGRPIFDVNTKLAAGKFTFLTTHSAFRYLDAFPFLLCLNSI